MASQIPGYEYDIFISYRHNDNKTLPSKGPGHDGTGDGWVSKFVANLGLELEATVKGKVNIYFDENPHDGLLETHNVDESLSPKIRSLIFIPVISQTYCDPDSFAWRSEFLAFNKMAAEDKFGPTIKLLNGNATNRVLPVRIHELDASDIKMLEAELKGRLRPIDFIFKAPGVNRPLRAHEDDPHKNINKTTYRDQVNKTANAIKDIINGLKNFGNVPLGFEEKKPIPSILSGSDKKIILIKSIAVLPFAYAGKELEHDYLGEEIAEEVLLSLSRLGDLKVATRASSFQYRDPQGSTRSIGKSLSVAVVIEGSVIKKTKGLTVAVRMTKTDETSAFWSREYDRGMSELFLLPAHIVYDSAEALQVTLKEAEKKVIGKKTTLNGSAYESFLKARFYRNRTIEDLVKSLAYFEDAVANDPQFARAHAGIAEVNALLSYHGLIPFQEGILKSKEAALRALDIDPALTEAYSVLAFISMCYELNWPEAEQFFSKVFSINPAKPNSEEKFRLKLRQIASSFEESKSELLNTIPYFLRAYAFLHMGKFDEALTAAEDAVKRDPNSFMAHRAVGLSYLGLEKYERSIQSLEEAATLSNRHQWLLFELMGAYSQAGKRDEAIAIMDETMELANILPARIYNFFFPY